MKKKLFMIMGLFFSSCFGQKKCADMVIFSYDRPMQLYALLESIEAYMEGVGDIYVIVRSSSPDYTQAYEKVSQDFPQAVFLFQGANPKEDFKPLTLQATFESPSEYIIFAVDDIIVKDFVDLSECIELLERYNAHGFYLRLGKNITVSYTMNRKVRQPRLTEVQAGVFTWNFKDGVSDWGYPHTVDMTVYRKADIYQDFHAMNYSGPNYLESNWSGRKPKQSYGICFAESKMVNLPLNRVQSVFKNRVMNFLTPQELLDRFYHDERIDIRPLFKIMNASPHMEYSPEFIEG